MTRQELPTGEVASFHAEELNCLGRLVAGIAHEINSPLGALRGNADTMRVAATTVASWFLRNANQMPEEIQCSVRVLTEAGGQLSIATERVNEIIKRLEEFAQLDRPELQPVCLGDCVENTLRMMGQEFHRDIGVVREFEDVPEIEASPRQLNRLLMNLLANAQEAIRQGGRAGQINIRIFPREDYAGVEIEDNGCGILPEALSKIFDPGFTTKGAQVGTGLGLAICYQIIRAHRGRISVQSRVGAGTRFLVLLPMKLRTGLPGVEENSGSLSS